MRVHNNIWIKFKYISLGLILLNLILYTFHIPNPNVEYGIKERLNELLYYSPVLALYLILALMVGFVISNVPLIKRRFDLSFSKGFVISLLLIFSISLIHPIDSLIECRKIKVLTDNSIVHDYIEYDTPKVKIFFRKSEVIDLCNKVDNRYHNLDYVDSLKWFIQNSDSNILIHSRDYYYLPDTLVNAYTFSSLSPDTFPILDKKDIRNLYSDGMEYVVNVLIKKPGYRLYDKNKSKFIDYVYYRVISDELGGVTMLCYLPDGEVFLERTLILGL